MEIKHLPHPLPAHMSYFIDHGTSTQIAILGELIDLMDFPVLLARESESVGILSYRLHLKRVEILSLFSVSPQVDLRSALLDQLESYSRTQGCLEICIMVTNNNLDALDFYQRRGFALRSLYPNAVASSRLQIPGIPLTDQGLPIRDELVLGKALTHTSVDFYQHQVFHVKHHLTLRPFQAISYDHIIELFSDPKVLRYQAMEAIETEKDAKAYYIHIYQRIQEEKRLVRGIFVQDNFVGLISLNQIQGDHCYLGYSLLPTYWNQGIATDAAIAMIRIAIDQLGIRRIQAITHPDNIASIRLLERLRFHQEGTLIDYLLNPRSGRYENRETHALLAKNFK